MFLTNQGQGRGEEDAAAAKRTDLASVLAQTTTAAVASPVSSSAAADEAQATVVARRRSLFNLGMSLAAGAVAWSADSPCLPLLAGLFATVGVSMRSVLLLTSPMLPGVVRASRALGLALTGLAAAPL